MAHKVILIPSAKPELFSETQLDEIDRANLFKPANALAERTRPEIEETLKVQCHLFLTANALRTQVAIRMQRVLDRLAIGKDEIRLAMGTESIGESTSWADLNELVIQLLAHLSRRRLEPPEATIQNPNETDDREIHDELMALMGSPKGGYPMLSRLINKGMELEAKHSERKSNGRLGRDPFKP